MSNSLCFENLIKAWVHKLKNSESNRLKISIGSFITPQILNTKIKMSKLIDILSVISNYFITNGYKYECGRRYFYDNKVLKVISSEQSKEIPFISILNDFEIVEYISSDFDLGISLYQKINLEPLNFSNIKEYSLIDDISIISILICDNVILYVTIYPDYINTHIEVIHNYMLSDSKYNKIIMNITEVLQRLQKLENIIYV